MTAVAFQLPPLEQIDAEEKNELAGLIGFALTPNTSDAQLDAIASDICRHLGYRMANFARYEEARKAEVLRINMHYNARAEPLVKEMAQLRAVGEEIARRAKFPGKSKSRSVAFGSYGSRKSTERVAIVDDQLAIVSIAKLNPALVHSVPQIKFAEVKDVVMAHLKSTGEVLEGFEHFPESETFFVKAEG